MAAYIVPCLVFAAMIGGSFAMSCVAGNLRPCEKYDFRVNHWVDPATLATYSAEICTAIVAANNNQECRKLCYRIPDCKFGSYEHATGSCTLARGPWKKARYLEDKDGWDVLIVRCTDIDGDDDPHFMVSVEGSKLPVCFDYNGYSGEILQLVKDQDLDIMMNGLLGLRHLNGTFFVELYLKSTGCSLDIGSQDFVVGNKVQDWTPGVKGRCGNFQYEVVDDTILNIMFKEKIPVTVRRKTHHRYLDFTLPHQQLSNSAEGILGQFIGMEINVESIGSRQGVISFPSHPDRESVTAKKVWRSTTMDEDKMPCWKVDDEGRALMDRDPEEYVILSDQVERRK